MSDSHCQHRRLPSAVPDGDVFIHAGDFTCHGRENDIRDFGSWVRALPHRHKIVIAGNHDVALQTSTDSALGWLGRGITYLCDSGVTIDGVRFWGSPWHPRVGEWAFGLPRSELRYIWDLIPDDTDVLITHGPPAGILDQTGDDEHAGCAELLAAVQRVAPRVHVFGHVHEGAGAETVDATRFYNVAVTGMGNRMKRGCTVIDMDAGGPAVMVAPAATDAADAAKRTAEATVESLYRTILGRPSDPNGLAHYTAMITSGRRTALWVAQTLESSAEAKAKRGH